jgi:hypothetical protein
VTDPAPQILSAPTRNVDKYEEFSSDREGYNDTSHGQMPCTKPEGAGLPQAAPLPLNLPLQHHSHAGHSFEGPEHTAAAAKKKISSKLCPVLSSLPATGRTASPCEIILPDVPTSSSDQPSVPLASAQPSHDQIEAKAVETYQIAEETGSSTKAADVTQIASASEETSAVGKIGGSTGWHTSTTDDDMKAISLADKANLGGKNGLAANLLVIDKGAATAINSITNKPVKSLLVNVDKISFEPGGCQLATSLDKAAKAQQKCIYMEAAVLAAHGMGVALEMEDKVDCSPAGAESVMNQVIDKSLADPSSVHAAVNAGMLIAESASTYSQTPTPHTHLFYGGATEITAVLPHESAPGPADGASSVISSTEVHISLENEGQSLATTDLMSGVLQTETSDMVEESGEALSVGSTPGGGAHQSIHGRKCATAADSKSPEPAQLMPEASNTSNQKTIIPALSSCTVEAGYKPYTASCRPDCEANQRRLSEPVLQGEEKQQDSECQKMPSEMLASIDAVDRGTPSLCSEEISRVECDNMPRLLPPHPFTDGMEVAGLSSAGQKYISTGTRSAGAVLSVIAVAGNSKCSGEALCRGSNGADVNINTNVCSEQGVQGADSSPSRSGTNDNREGCAAASETLLVKNNKRQLQYEKLGQLEGTDMQNHYSSLLCTKKQKGELSRQVRDSSAAVSAKSISEAGGSSEDAAWLWWWKELDPLPPRRVGRPPIGARVVVQGQGHQGPRRGVVIDIVGKCWCNVALEADEFGAQQNSTSLELWDSVRCRTNTVRVMSAAEEDRIKATAAKRTASRPGAKPYVAATPLSPPPGKAMEYSLGNSSEQYCVEVTCSKQSIVLSNCLEQGAEIANVNEQRAGLSDSVMLASQNNNTATEQQVSFLDRFCQSSQLSTIYQHSGEEMTEPCIELSTRVEGQGGEQVGIEQQGCSDTSKRAMLIIPVSDFTPVTAEPAVSWAFFGPDFSGTVPQLMQPP